MDQAFRKLRLSGARQTIDLKLQEAGSGRPTHLELLELILQDELAVRDRRLRQRRVKAAGFREMRSLDGFDWSFNSSIRRNQVYDLARAPSPPSHAR